MLRGGPIEVARGPAPLVVHAIEETGKTGSTSGQGQGKTSGSSSSSGKKTSGSGKKTTGSGKSTSAGDNTLRPAF